MGMIPELDRPSAASNPEVTALDRQHAKALHDALKPLNFLKPGCKPSTWADHFAKLRHLDNKTDAEVCEVFAWYLTSVGKPYTPEVFCGSSFRAKFERIVKAMERDRKPKLVLNAAATQTEPSPDAKKVLEALEHHHWPKGSRSRLPEAIETSLRNYKAFVQKLKNYSGKRVGLKNYIWDGLTPPATFVRDWFEQVCKDANGWADWSGKFTRKMILSEDNEDFVTKIMEAGGDYGSESAVYKLLEELK